MDVNRFWRLVFLRTFCTRFKLSRNWAVTSNTHKRFTQKVSFKNKYCCFLVLFFSVHNICNIVIWLYVYLQIFSCSLQWTRLQAKKGLFFVIFCFREIHVIDGLEIKRMNMYITLINRDGHCAFQYLIHFVCLIKWTKNERKVHSLCVLSYVFYTNNKTV